MFSPQRKFRTDILELPMSQINFGIWLKEELKKANISQTELAEKVNLTSSQISRIISGERGTTIDVLEGIARTLRIPPENVFRIAAGLGPKSEKSNLIQQIEYLVLDLPEEEQDNIYQYALLRHRLAEERGKYDAQKDDKNKRPSAPPAATQ